MTMTSALTEVRTILARVLAHWAVEELHVRTLAPHPMHDEVARVLDLVDEELREPAPMPRPGSRMPQESSSTAERASDCPDVPGVPESRLRFVDDGGWGR